MTSNERVFNGPYVGQHADRIAFPMGGMGAGMICLEGTGALSHFSLRHRPDLASRPLIYGALAIEGSPHLARVIEGPVPHWKLPPCFGAGTSRASPVTNWGLPRFAHASFEARFPFATVSLRDDAVPVEVEMTGWSPFIPGDEDNASLPVAALEYRFVNRGRSALRAVFSFHSENLLVPKGLPLRPAPAADNRIRSLDKGFLLYSSGEQSRPWDEGWFAIWTDSENVRVDHGWFRSGGLRRAQEGFWRKVSDARMPECAPLENDAAPGASIYVPLDLAPGETRTIAVRLAWYVPASNLSEPSLAFKAGVLACRVPSEQSYRPWYAGRFADIFQVVRFWETQYATLRNDSELFTRALYASTLPPEALEAVAANLTILKSPVALRQTDGRFWGWEGVFDEEGAWWGTSTHVWNYAQALAHLFPALERGLRETELKVNQDAHGRQHCRTPLPIRPIAELNLEADPMGSAPAADGQLGGIVKTYREWRICGDTAWLASLWPQVRASLDYCIRTWDPRHRGWIEEPHLNTYDKEFWGPDSLHCSLYLAALRAASLMGKALGDATPLYETLLAAGIARMESQLFNGEYFFQKTQWTGLDAAFPRLDPITGAVPAASPPVAAILETEGPIDQYGPGCLSDGVLGCWLAELCGVGEIVDAGKVKSHLGAVLRHNFKTSLRGEPSFSRPYFAMGDEGGLRLCTWPRGGRPSLPFTYSSEVWSGTEYQVAAHLIMQRNVEGGLAVLQAVQHRYDGRVRNPFAAVEAGHWYARAMSSYALLQAFSGARYDAVDQVLYLNPSIKGDFHCFLATAGGYGLVGIKNAQPFLQVICGAIPCERIVLTEAR